MKYVSIDHEVEASVIVGVGQSDENGSIPMCLDNGENLLATPHMFGNSSPTDGDYAVIRWNNLVDIVPKTVFEGMYKRAAESEAATSAVEETAPAAEESEKETVTVTAADVGEMPF